MKLESHTNSPDDFNLTSRSLKCPEHGHWLRLRQLTAAARGAVNFWACPEMGCHHYRPCKNSRWGPRAQSARARIAREIRDLPAWSNVVVINERRCTA